jgi:hypothetical protein
MFGDDWSISKSDRASFDVPMGYGADRNDRDLEMQQVQSDLSQNPRLITVKTAEFDSIKFQELDGLYVRKFITYENDGVFAEAGVSIGDLLWSVDGVNVSTMMRADFLKVLNCSDEVTARSSFVSKVRMHINGTHEPPDDSFSWQQSSSSGACSSVVSAIHSQSSSVVGRERTKSEVEYMRTRTWVFRHFRHNEDLRCFVLTSLSDVMLCSYVSFQVSMGCVLLGLIQLSTVLIIGSSSQVDHGMGPSRLTPETALATAYAAITIAATMYTTAIHYSIKLKNFAIFNKLQADALVRTKDSQCICTTFWYAFIGRPWCSKHLILSVNIATHIFGALCLIFTLAYHEGAVGIILDCTAILAVISLDQLILPFVKAPAVASKLLLDEYQKGLTEVVDEEGPDYRLVLFIVILYLVLCTVSYLGF